MTFEDWRAICELKARYCRLLDSKDWDGWAGLFTEDGVLDASAAGGPRLVGRDGIRDRIRSSLEHAQSAHQVHQPEITVNGDRASATWAMQDRVIWPGGRQLSGFGHYHEDYVRTEKGWQIAESRLTRLLVEMSGGD